MVDDILKIASLFYGVGKANPDVLLITDYIGVAKYATLRHLLDQDPVGNAYMKKPLAKLKVLDDFVSYQPCDVENGYSCMVTRDVIGLNQEVKFYQFSTICEYEAKVELRKSPKVEQQLEDALSEQNPGIKFVVSISHNRVVIADAGTHPHLKREV